MVFDVKRFLQRSLHKFTDSSNIPYTQIQLICVTVLVSIFQTQNWKIIKHLYLFDQVYRKLSYLLILCALEMDENCPRRKCLNLIAMCIRWKTELMASEIITYVMQIALLAKICKWTMIKWVIFIQDHTYSNSEVIFKKL